MYSPRISEHLVPVLYRTARHRRIPMTVLVNQLLLKALEGADLPVDAREGLGAAQAVLGRPVALKEAA